MTRALPRQVLITGASSGIGAATARFLAAQGLRVYGTSRRAASKEQFEHPDAEGIRWLALDVTEEASVDSAIGQLLAAEGQLDAIVCNAGVGIFGSVEETSIASAKQQFETNYFGVLRCLRAVLPGMRERGQGHVILVGSLAGRSPIPFQSHYSSSKAAIDALAGALRNEVAPLGVEVTLIEPGDIATPFNDATEWGESEASVYADRIARCRETIEELLPNAASPQVVAKAVFAALQSPRPRHRHAVGDDSWGAPLIKRLLPDRAFLNVIRRHFGL